MCACANVKSTTFLFTNKEKRNENNNIIGNVSKTDAQFYLIHVTLPQQNT